MAERRLYTRFTVDHVDPASEKLDDWVALMNRCMQEEGGPTAAQLTTSYLRESDHKENLRFSFLVVHAGHRDVGAALLELPADPQQNPVAFGLARVARTAQGFGVGMSLIHAMEVEATQHGCTAMSTTTSSRYYRDDRTTRLLRRAGYTVTDVLLRMDLPLDEVTAPISPSQGLEVSVLTEHTPPQVWESFARLMQEYSSSPDSPGDTTLDPEQVRAEALTPMLAGRHVLISLVLQEGTTEVVAAAAAESGDEDLLTEVDWHYATAAARESGAGTLALQHLSHELRCLRPQMTRLRTFVHADLTQSVEEVRAAGFQERNYYRDWIRPLREPPGDAQDPA